MFDDIRDFANRMDYLHDTILYAIDMGLYPFDDGKITVKDVDTAFHLLQSSLDFSVTVCYPFFSGGGGTTTLPHTINNQ